MQKLLKANFRLGLVPASPTSWINYVLARLPQPNIFEVIISINDSDLPSKPAPDGYLEAMKQLQVKPTETIHWPKNYSAPGANHYINSLKELGFKLNSVEL